MEDKCLQCGTHFTALSVNQKYCCTKCGVRYRTQHRAEMKFPSITFDCAQCGRHVVTEEGSHDMRTRFCCETCEKKFWRHPHWENTSNRINFRSVGEYISYEKRMNNI